MKRTKRILAAVLVLVMALALTGCNASDYKKAAESMEIGEYAEASAAFKALADYKDSAEQATECDYLLAAEKLDGGEYAEAKELFQSIGDYKDSADQTKECDYLLATEKLDGGEYAEAKELFGGIGDYKDSGELVSECDYLTATELLDGEKYEEAMELFGAIESYKDSAELLAEAKNCLLEERVVGNWISDEIDLTDLVVAVTVSEMGEDAEMLFQYCPLEGFTLRMKAELTDSGNIYISCDEESFKKAIENLGNCIKSGFGEYLMAIVEQSLAEEGVTMADFEAMIGEPVTPEYLASEMYGMSLDELREYAFDTSELVEPSIFASSGTWEIEDGRIRYVNALSSEYAEYDLEKDEMTFTGEGLEDAETVEYMYPIIFKRA